MPKSLLFTGGSPLSAVPGCEPGRQETAVTMRKDGRLYKLVMRDRISVEDPYLLMVKATAFAIKNQEAYPATPTARDIRDYLIKANVVI